MATIMLARGRPETIAVFAAAGGTAPNDYRIPQDIQGARLAWEVVYTGAATAGTVTLQPSVDGINYGTSTTTTGFFSTVAAANVVDVQVVAVEGIMAIRATATALTGGTSPTATVIVRCA